MKDANPPKPSVETLMEGYYVVHVLDALRSTGVLERIAEAPGVGVTRLAADAGMDADMLRHLLDYLARCSEVIVASGEGYALDRDSAEVRFALHMVDQYAGAYGPCLRALPDLLTGRAEGAPLVDAARHASAFAAADGNHADRDVLRLLCELAVTQVADLGCGTGGLLIEHARTRPEARGIGLDASAPAVQAARSNAARAGLSERLTFVRGDVRDTATSLPEPTRDAVQCVVAQNVANAFFARADGADLVRVLSGWRAAFPRRLLILGDYIGTLGHPEAASADRRRGMIHDVAQVLSGQGVPPGDVQGWAQVLDAAGCTLIKAYRGEGGGMSRVILLAQL